MARTTLYTKVLVPLHFNDMGHICMDAWGVGEEKDELLIVNCELLMEKEPFSENENTGSKLIYVLCSFVDRMNRKIVFSYREYFIGSYVESQQVNEEQFILMK